MAFHRLRMVFINGTNFTPRGLSTSSISETKHNVNQIYKLTNKYFANAGNVSGKKRNKRNLDNHFTEIGMQMNENPKPKQKDVVVNHRLNKLSKVFTGEVAELLSLHDCAKELSESGMEIVKCQVLSDYSYMNIHWMCRDTRMEAQLTELLYKLAPYLRHNLIQRRIIGRVPRIRFVRDNNHFKLTDVEKALAVADYGPDFEPYDPQHYTKAEIIRKQISDDVWQSIDKVSQEIEPDVDVDADLSILAPIRDDIFGVKRDRIMMMVEKEIKGLRADHRKEDFISTTPIGDHLTTESQSVMERYQNVEPSTNNTRVQDIKKWVEQYQREKRRKAKEFRRMTDESMLDNEQIGEEDENLRETNEDVYDNEEFLREYDAFCEEDERELKK